VSATASLTLVLTVHPSTLRRIHRFDTDTPPFTRCEVGSMRAPHRQVERSEVTDLVKQDRAGRRRLQQPSDVLQATQGRVERVGDRRCGHVVGNDE
jgi:hypothetical protein